MIHEVDASLGKLIVEEALDGADVEVIFDAPTKEWSSRRTRPAVNVFLYDVREDLARRDVAPVRLHDRNGMVVDRTPPPRRFKLAYLLSVWTQRPEDEHRLLSQLLAGLIRHDRIPPEHLGGSLAELGMPVLMQLALPPPQDRSLSDIWSALGGEMKPSIDLTLNAPLDTGRSFAVGPPTLEEPRVRMMEPSGLEAPRRKGKRKDERRPATVSDPDHSGGEILQAGTDDQPGRTLKVRRVGDT